MISKSINLETEAVLLNAPPEAGIGQVPPGDPGGPTEHLVLWEFPKLRGPLFWGVFIKRNLLFRLSTSLFLSLGFGVRGLGV